MTSSIRVMSDARLNANPAVNEAHHKVSPAGLQVSRHRNGLLGGWRPAEIHGALHARLSSALEHNARKSAGCFH